MVRAAVPQQGQMQLFLLEQIEHQDFLPAFM
jgi:hypothetical protein